MLGRGSLLSTRDHDVIWELWRKKPAKSFIITEILGVYSIKNFSGKWQTPLSPYTLTLHRAAVTGQDLANQCLSHLPSEGGGLGHGAQSPHHQGCLWWQSRAVLQVGHKIRITRAQAQYDCSTAQAGINHKSFSSPKWRRRPSPSSVFFEKLLAASLQGCTFLLLLSKPSAAPFVSLPWAQAAKPPGKSGEKEGPDTHLLMWLVTPYKHFICFTMGWATLLPFCNLYLRQLAQARVAWELQHAAVPVSCKRFLLIFLTLTFLSYFLGNGIFLRSWDWWQQ